jgi:hypothetical protein
MASQIYDLGEVDATLAGGCPIIGTNKVDKLTYDATTILRQDFTELTTLDGGAEERHTAPNPSSLRALGLKLSRSSGLLHPLGIDRPLGSSRPTSNRPSTLAVRA